MQELINLATNLTLDGMVGSRPAFYAEAPGNYWVARPWPASSLLAKDFEFLHINYPTGMHVLTMAERAALERALWRSVEILDEGFED